MASEFMVETNQNQDGAKPDETSSSSEGLLEQIQMFMSEEQKARLYKNNNLQQPANSRPAISLSLIHISMCIRDRSNLASILYIDSFVIYITNCCIDLPLWLISYPRIWGLNNNMACLLYTSRCV